MAQVILEAFSKKKERKKCNDLLPLGCHCQNNPFNKRQYTSCHNLIFACLGRERELIGMSVNNVIVVAEKSVVQLFPPVQH
jgi:hypothetical protein